MPHLSARARPSNIIKIRNLKPISADEDWDLKWVLERIHP